MYHSEIFPLPLLFPFEVMHLKRNIVSAIISRDTREQTERKELERSVSKEQDATRSKAGPGAKRAKASQVKVAKRPRGLPHLAQCTHSPMQTTGLPFPPRVHITA